MAEPTDTKPYLLRALYEWCVDNGWTPYLAVQVDAHSRVPREHVKNGEIVLNIGPAATNKLRMGNDTIEFEARFGGVARALSVPVSGVSAIYARENGQGMAFQVAPAEGAPAEPVDARPVGEPDPTASTSVPARSKAPSTELKPAPPDLRSVPDTDPSGPSAPRPPHSPDGRPGLRRIK